MNTLLRVGGPLACAALAALAFFGQGSAEADANCGGPGEKVVGPTAMLAWCAVPANVASACGQSARRKQECQYARPAKQYLDAQHATRTFFPGVKQTSNIKDDEAVNMDPAQQVTGPYHPFVANDPTFKNRAGGQNAGPGPLQPAATTRSFSVGRLGELSAAFVQNGLNPLTWSSNPAYEQDGFRVGSCNEYVYKAFYDWSRFEDAVAACKGDYTCQFDAAYGWQANAPPSNGNTPLGPDQAPRIARRTLMDKDNPRHPLPPDPDPTTHALPAHGQMSLLEGTMAKNAWFNAIAPYFAATGNALSGAGGTYVKLGDPRDLDPQLRWLAQYFPPQFAQDFADLGAALVDGRVYYHIKGPSSPAGDPGTNEDYDDEWQFHAAMRGKTVNNTEEASSELERRTKKIETWAQQGTFDYTYDGAPYLAGTPYDFQPWQKYEIDFNLGADPFAQSQAFADPVGMRRSVGNNLGLNFIPAAQLGGAQVAAARPVTMGAGTAQPVPPKGNGWAADPSSATPRFQCRLGVTTLSIPLAPIGQRQGVSAPGVDQQAAAMTRCKLYNEILDEWFVRRKHYMQNGGCKDNTNCGCLHIGNGSYGCDWSLQQFSERWVKPGRYIQPRSQDMNTCKKYAPYATSQTSDSVTNYGRNVIGLGQPPALGSGKQQYGVIAKLPTLDNAPLSFGAGAADSPYFGDKDFFAAGYSYDVGWGLTPAKLWNPPATAQDAHPAPQVCQMSGNAHAYFSADAWLFGDHLSVVDADAWLKANEHNDRHVDYETHLRILTVELSNYGIPGNPGSGATFTEVNAPHADDTVNQATTCGNNRHACDGKTLTRQSWGDSQDIPNPHPTISMGPCPFCVNGSVWATIGYGATLTPKITLDKDPCTHQSSDFGIEVVAVPYASLAADVEVSVGIPIICSVGVLGEITLADIHLPVTTSLDLTEKPDATQKMTPAVDFSVGVDATFATLGGRIALDFQFLFTDTQVEIYKWPGLGPYREEIVKPIDETLFLTALDTYAVAKRNTVHPPL